MNLEAEYRRKLEAAERGVEKTHGRGFLASGVHGGGIPLCDSVIYFSLVLVCVR